MGISWNTFGSHGMGWVTSAGSEYLTSRSRRRCHPNSVAGAGVRALRMLQARPVAGAGARSTRSLVAVLAFLAVGLTLAANLWSQSGTTVIITGAVTSGVPFVRSFGTGFALRLQGQHGIWVIEITHAGSGEKDLIYPVNPPYRFSNHQYIGPGYGESARESASNTPREFAFL